ncbi:hypothetical protein [Nocardia australiensis]|uniref:hypothetical protein n=1 Tax=Nocardia australiensis TaxID=2887191 RepID=UPI001D13A4E2|nr:hypothetical protein [Nocardia australiensis]
MTARRPRQASVASRQGPSIADAITAQRQLTPRDLRLLAAHRALTAHTAGSGLPLSGQQERPDQLHTAVTDFAFR